MAVHTSCHWCFDSLWRYEEAAGSTATVSCWIPSFSFSNSDSWVRCTFSFIMKYIASLAGHLKSEAYRWYGTNAGSSLTFGGCLSLLFCTLFPSFLPGLPATLASGSVPDTEAKAILKLFSQFPHLCKVKFQNKYYNVPRGTGSVIKSCSNITHSQSLRIHFQQ